MSNPLIAFGAGCFVGLLLIIGTLLVLIRREKKRSFLMKKALNEVYGRFGSSSSCDCGAAPQSIKKEENLSDSRLTQGLPPKICPCGNSSCKRGGWS